MQTRVYVLMAADKTCVHVIYGSLLAAKMILEREKGKWGNNESCASWICICCCYRWLMCEIRHTWLGMPSAYNCGNAHVVTHPNKKNWCHARKLYIRSPNHYTTTTRYYESNTFCSAPGFQIHFSYSQRSGGSSGTQIQTLHALAWTFAKAGGGENEKFLHLNQMNW